MTPLFEPGPRGNPAAKGHLEGSFEFYDRAGTPYWAEVRRVLDQWFDRYPDSDKNRLRGDLTSADDRASDAALWELLLHELYSRAAFALEVHPTLVGTSRTPDFLVSQGQASFLLEARVVNDESEEARLRQKRRRAIYEVIDKVRPSAFYIRLEILRDGEQQPRVRDLTSKLRAWLDKLDPDAVEQAVLESNDLRKAPSTKFESHGWHLRFSAVPVRAERRGKLSGPMLGIFPVETFIGDPSLAVRAALRRKGARYGDTELPLVIALAIEGTFVHDDDIASALFGTTVAQLDARDPALVIDEYRKQDGYFRPNRGQRVAGVLTVATPRPMFAPRLVPRLWLNPWATRPYSAKPLWEWTTLDPDTGALQNGPATVTTAELLGLPEDWPPGRPFDSEPSASSQGVDS